MKVLDADTITLDIDLGFHLTRRESVRLYGCNAPEIHTKDVLEKKRGLEAKYRVAELLPVGSTVKVKSYKPDKPTEKFGRYLAMIEMPGGGDLVTKLLEDGHVKPWDGQGVRPV